MSNASASAERDAATPADTLLKAILAVQGEVGTLPKDAVNPAFQKGGKGGRYTPLDTIVEMVGPILNKHGLIWMTFPTVGENGQSLLKYRLQHAETNEEVGGIMPLLLTKQDPQGLGSALTYARRYSLCAVLNLVADEDDDAAATRDFQTAGDLARARARMDDDAKALLAKADGIYTERFTEKALSKADYARYKDSTRYTVDGLQQLVDWLGANAPAEAAA